MEAGKRGKRGGRKKGQLNKSTREIKAILDSVVDWDSVAQRLYDIATGPDRVAAASAAKTLIEFRFGKAPQSMKIEGNDRTPTEVVVTIVKPS